VIAALPADAEVHVKTLADAGFLRREAGRPIELTGAAFDFGAWQASNMAIDWERTFEAAMRVHAESRRRLDDEVEFLRSSRIDVVVCDIPPTPLLAAQRAAIPSVCVANFTWVEVFRRAAAGHRNRERFLDQMAAEYATASLLLRPGFALQMPQFSRVRDTAIIARRGHDVRQALRARLGLPASTRLVLTYLGKWGLGDLKLARAGAMRGVALLSFDSEEAAFRRLDPDEWKFEDVVASVDAVIAKPGYGTMGECMANGTPVIYYPRCEFSEYFALRRELDRWGGAVRLSTPDFVAGRWEPALARAASLQVAPVPTTGALEIADWIVRVARGRQG
jgi:hypothetical protein